MPAAATAPALVIVGIFMMQSITEIDMTDFKVAAPAVLTLLAIPLTAFVVTAWRLARRKYLPNAHG